MLRQINHAKIDWPQYFSKFASACAIIIGFSSILCWTFYLWMPTSIASVLTDIKPNVAFSFILTGIAIWLSCEKRTKLRATIIEVCSALIFLIGFMTLFEYFFNINLKIDEFIIKEPVVNFKHTIFSDRMTPLTAVNFILIGFTLFFLENKVITNRANQFFILAVFIISFFEFLNHIYMLEYHALIINIGINIFQISLFNSVMFMLLSLGILTTRPQQGIISIIISKNNGGKLARRLIPPAMILPILLGYLGLIKTGNGAPEIDFGITVIVLATSLFFTALILINSYLIEKSDIMRKQSMQNLKLSQALALKSAEAGTWNWNIIHNVFTLDEQLYRLFGIKKEEFPGYFEAIYNYIHPKDRLRVHDQIKNCLDKGFEYESEFRVIHEDGSVHVLASRGHIYRNDSGKAISMSGICWDVTHHKQVEEDLRHAKEIAEKLAESAESANRAKSAFLTAMSHEIRTPLNGVLGMLGLLYDTPLSSDQRRHIETARLSGEELLTVINDILDFSKIESGKMELEILDFNLQNLIDDTIEMYASQVQHKHLAIGAVVEENVPQWLTGDPSRVRQVLSNLLNNATKFTEKGEISIRVKLANQEVDQVVLLFEISDTGIGISPEVRNRLFKPFSQGDVSDSRRHGGTGLGLVIAKRLVEMMGGIIHVKSQPGKGSTFWFTIKLLACEAPEVETRPEMIPEFRNSRILCVDDNSINREIFKRQIEFLGLQCDLASNAGEALSMLKKAANDGKPYELALIDCSMPGMDGLEMIQVIRQLNEIANTNVILMSSTEAGFGLNEMKNLNILMSINKPIRQNKLHENIIAALQMIHGQEVNTVNESDQTDKKSARILLAEDNFVNQQVALGVLNKLGYNAVAVTNGLEALEEFKRNQYDLILMDCQMPEMDGYTATEEIRKLEQQQKKHIVIIAMTAHALKGDREKCIKSGMDDYISKPIDIKLLASMLKSWLFGIKKSKGEEVMNTEPAPKEPNFKSENKIIDMNRIYEIFGDDKPAIQVFLNNLVASTESLLNEITVAVQNKDEKNSKDLFHRLKGSCGNSGIMEIHKLSLEAEERVKQADWNSVDKIFVRINELFKKLKAEANV